MSPLWLGTSSMTGFRHVSSPDNRRYPRRQSYSGGSGARGGRSTPSEVSPEDSRRHRRYKRRATLSPVKEVGGAPETVDPRWEEGVRQGE